MAGPVLLIAAFSGRGIAMAARRAGFSPCVADLFADVDTRAVAAAARRVPGDLADGFGDDALMEALTALAEEVGSPPAGLVYGAGFEDRPALLARIGARWPLLGNMPETVAAAKDPWRLAEGLARLGIAHPDIRAADVAPGPGWLIKRGGAAGGGHVAASVAASGGTGRGALYAQRRVEGRAISALVLAGARDAAVIGFSEQWTAPAPGQPFRFGGAMAPAGIADNLAAAFTDAAIAAAREFGLRGLNGIDFLVGPDGWWLIEINPRPGATLDLFDGAEGHALIASHIAAVRGAPLPVSPRLSLGAAIQIVYAPRAIAVMPNLDWPRWALDRPHAGEAIPEQAPLCTIHAHAVTAWEARRLCAARARALIEMLEPSSWTPSFPARPASATRASSV